MTTVISGDTGVSQVQAGSINQDDLAANVVGKGPAFSARRTGTATITAATWTWLLFNTEEFDTTNAYDSVTTGKFQPTVAGYYQFNVTVQGSGSTNITTLGAGFYKNKSTGQADYYSIWEAPPGVGTPAVSCSAIIFLNGTTDYVNATTYMRGAGVLTWLDNNANFFQGVLVRAA